MVAQRPSSPTPFCWPIQETISRRRRCRCFSNYHSSSLYHLSDWNVTHSILYSQSRCKRWSILLLLVVGRFLIDSCCRLTWCLPLALMPPYQPLALFVTKIHEIPLLKTWFGPSDTIDWLLIGKIISGSHAGSWETFLLTNQAKFETTRARHQQRQNSLIVMRCNCMGTHDLDEYVR